MVIRCKIADSGNLWVQSELHIKVEWNIDFRFSMKINARCNRAPIIYNFISGQSFKVNNEKKETLPTEQDAWCHQPKPQPQLASLIRPLWKRPSPRGQTPFLLCLFIVVLGIHTYSQFWPSACVEGCWILHHHHSSLMKFHPPSKNETWPENNILL